MKINFWIHKGWKYYVLFLVGIAVITFLVVVIPSVWTDIPLIIEIFAVGYICAIAIIVGLNIYINNKSK